MSAQIRLMQMRDKDVWAAMRHRLWDHMPVEEHLAEIELALIDGSLRGFIAEMGDGTPAGFAEMSLLPYANGCTDSPVAFLEDIWVEEPFRHMGVGGQLVQFISDLLRREGRVELCSDVPVENLLSQDAHAKWGFEETERVVYFRKSLA